MNKINNLKINIQSFAYFIFIIASELFEPYKRTFSLYDKSIANPFKKEMLSFLTVLLVSFILPMIASFIYFRCNPRYKHLELTYYSYFISAHLFVIGITCFLKILVGRLRPDFLDRCQYKDGKCTGKYNIVKEGRKSFPSGHTSTMFCGIVWMIIYTARIVKAKVIMLILQLILAKTAVFVGWSRIKDFRHFLSDVIVGSFIGTFSSICFVILLRKKLQKNHVQNNATKEEEQ